MLEYVRLLDTLVFIIIGIMKTVYKKKQIEKFPVRDALAQKPAIQLLNKCNFQNKFANNFQRLIFSDTF
jgi:hypothetical protein